MVQWASGLRQDGNRPVTLQTMCGYTVACRKPFFSRYAHGRSNAEFLFPTISFGLSYAIPDVGRITNAVVAHDPSIPTKALEIQLQKLILEPLQQVKEESK